MPSERQLAGIRARYAARLPRTCTIPGALTVTNNGDGTYTEAPDGSTPEIRCSFKPASGSERIVNGAVASLSQYVMRFEFGVVLSPQMTIEVDADEDKGMPAKTFQLVAPLDGAVQIGQQWLATSEA